MLFKHRTSLATKYIRSSKNPLYLPKKFAGTFNDYFANITEHLYEKKIPETSSHFKDFLKDKTINSFLLEDTGEKKFFN